MLEELRLLTNYNMDAENRLCLLLLGQSELRRRLSMAVHEALSQRIVVRYHLSPSPVQCSEREFRRRLPRHAREDV